MYVNYGASQEISGPRQTIDLRDTDKCRYFAQRCPIIDMTAESALAKLSFVMGEEALTQGDRKMVSFTFRFEVRYLKTNASSGDFRTLCTISGVLCRAVLLGILFSFCTYA